MQYPSHSAEISVRGIRDSVKGNLDNEKLNSCRLEELERLEDTAEEVRNIAASVGADLEKDLFLNVQASENRVKTMDLSDRRIIVFATHALIPGDIDGLTQPALALSSPQVTGETGDGLLSMQEVFGLNLNADWVVLSACNTAAGEDAGAESMSGLGRAFFSLEAGLCSSACGL
jgi:CHAT domain-containing protein